jgi:LysM repeat protein
MYVFTEIADDFDRTRIENHKFLDQTWNEVTRDWDDYIAKHGADPAYMNALHNVMVVGEYAGLAALGVANDVGGTVASGFLDFLRIGDGVRAGGWGYAQDALRLLMVTGPTLKLAGVARVGLVRVFQVDPGGGICALITARAALMMTGVRHFISLGKVLEAVGIDVSMVEEFKGLAPSQLKALLTGFGATVRSVRATGATVEEALVNALADNPRTVATFGVRWQIPVFDAAGQLAKVEEVGHRMLAMRDATTGALKIFDRSAMTAYDSLAALERAGYPGISQAALVGDDAVILVENSTIVNMLEDGTAWAMPISGVAATVEAVEAAFPVVDRTGVAYTDSSWIPSALAMEVRSIPFRVEPRSTVHVPLRAVASKNALVPQKIYFHRDLFSDGAKMGWTDISVDSQTYTVQSGDTLSSIAKLAYGDARLWKWIAANNGIAQSDAKTIQSGQVLRILPLDIAERLRAPAPDSLSAGPWLPASGQ